MKPRWAVVAGFATGLVIALVVAAAPSPQTEQAAADLIGPYQMAVDDHAIYVIETKTGHVYCRWLRYPFLGTLDLGTTADPRFRLHPYRRGNGTTEVVLMSEVMTAAGQTPDVAWSMAANWAKGNLEAWQAIEKVAKDNAKLVTAARAMQAEYERGIRLVQGDKTEGIKSLATRAVPEDTNEPAAKKK